MTKRRAASTHPTAQAPSPTAPAMPSSRRTDPALHPKAPLEVLLSRALDQELEWYFAYGEAALGRDDVSILPSYVAVRILADGTSAASPRRGQHLGETTEDMCRARGHELARTVRGCLHVLPTRHASVLRAAYTPRRWPKPVEKAFDVLAPIAVRLAFAEDPWPQRSARAGLEEATANRLSAALVDPAMVKVAQIRAQAQRLLGSAVVAYAKARAEVAPALEVR
jgi:hypothetical protein